MTFVHYQFNDLNCSGGVCLCSESFSLRKKIKRWREIGVLCIAFNSSDFRISHVERFGFFWLCLFKNCVSYEHHYRLLKTICMKKSLFIIISHWLHWHHLITICINWHSMIDGRWWYKPFFLRHTSNVRDAIPPKTDSMLGDCVNCC